MQPSEFEIIEVVEFVIQISKIVVQIIKVEIVLIIIFFIVRRSLIPFLFVELI